jgi:tetratricopeptide (TPR) repeat protein/transglutaminase-like putative cysteine protease
MRAVPVLIGLSLLTLTRAAWAGPLDKPPFTATPQELLAEAKAVAGTDAEVVVLRDDLTISYDEAGRAERRYRVVAAILKPSAVDSWGTLSIDWRPFYQERPTIRARVVAPDGTVATIDPKLFHDAPTVSESPSIFSDRRKLEAPLPRLSVGAVFEEEFVIRDREPLLAEGEVDRTYIGRGVPVQRTIMTIEATAKRRPTIVARGFARPPTAKQSTRAGRSTWTYDLGASAPIEHYDLALPGDASTVPYIGVATGKDWAAIAAGYRRLVEAKLTASVAPPADIKGATQRDTVDRTLAWLHAHVRYTGIELADSAIIPYTPAETLDRGFGDCKDKATLLAALLRANGIPADLALLSTGPGVDVDRSLAGLGEFDHAIVRAKVDGKDLWIDATEDGLPAGQLPSRDQGRLALVIAADTRDLTMTPVPKSADNLVREVRTYTLAEIDGARAHEISTEHGVFRDNLRSWTRNAKQSEINKSLGEYAERQYGGKLASFTANDPGDITKPFSLVVEIEKVSFAYTGRDQVDAWLRSADTLTRVPDLVGSEDKELDADVARRTADYVWDRPHVVEIENRLVIPTGFTAPTIATASEKRALGTMTLATTRRMDGNTFVITYRFDSGPRRITAAQLRATRAATLALQKEANEHLVIPQTGAMLLAAGKTDAAVAEYKRLIALHPKEGLHHGQLAEAYSKVGMGSAARRAARRRVELDPDDSDAYVVLAVQLQRDTTGRTLGFDGDRDGAMAAYRKALTLNPEHRGALAGLAWLLTVDRRGWASMKSRDLLEAIALWRRLAELDESDAYDFRIVEKLFDAGRYAEAEAAARELPASDEAHGLQVAAAAAARGAPVALTLARSLAPGATRMRVHTEARGRLMRVRMYDLVRAVDAEISSGGPPTHATMIAALEKIDLARLDPANPRTPALLAIRTMMGVEPLQKPWNAEVGWLFLDGARQANSNPAIGKLRDMSQDAVFDLFVALAAITVDGDAKTGWRVTTTFGNERMFLYVRLSKGRAELVGYGGMAGGLGGEIRARIAAKDLVGAKRWLERFTEDLDRITTFKPPAAEAVGTLYREELAGTGDRPPREVLEVAGALLGGEADKKASIPVLRRCAVKSAEVKTFCRQALLWLLADARSWTEAAEIAASMEDDDDILALRTHALAGAGRGKEALALVDKAIALRPKDVDLLARRAYVTLEVEGFAKGETWLERAATHADVTENVLNSIAWTRAFHDPTMSRALAMAHRAETLSRDVSPALANTLALVEAEAGNPHRAWTYLQRSHPRLPYEPPIEDDWYVYGRIAEHLGLKDDAIAAYKRVGKQPDLVGVPTTAEFAERALKRLGAHASP